MSLIVSIEAALAPLIGLPLWSAGRAAGMLWLQFGAKVHAPTSRDPTRVVGEYALHMQCSWRVSGPAGVVVGSADVFQAMNDEVPWDAQGNSRVDAPLRDWLEEHRDHPRRVTSLRADRCGGFILSMTDASMFEVFPDAAATSDDEAWRLLLPGQDGAHIVLCGSRLE